MTVTCHKISGVRYWVVCMSAGPLARGSLAVDGPSPSLCTLVSLDGGTAHTGQTERLAGYVVTWDRTVTVRPESEQTVRLILAEGFHSVGGKHGTI